MALSTTTTSFFSSSTATAPILAFTTPFPQPASCSSPALTTTVISREGYPGGTWTTTYTYLVANKSDPWYTACIAPAGGQFTFSPAVCPEDWPAWYLGTASSGVSTAYCCAPGYSMWERPATTDQSPSCFHEFLFRTESSSTIKDAPRQATLPAWHITWQSTDLPTMSPKPPAIEGEKIMKWVPGSDPERELPQPSSSGSSEGGGTNMLVVIIPVITLSILSVIGMLFCFTSCCSRGNRGWSRGLRAPPAPAPAPAPL